jgi:hypothetical protein
MSRFSLNQSIHSDGADMWKLHSFQLSRTAFIVCVLLLSVTAVAYAGKLTLLGGTRGQWRERLEGGDEIARAQAVNALSQFPDVPVEELASALADESATVRFWATRGLKQWSGTKGSKEDKLVTASLQNGIADKSAAVRIEAAAGLAQRDETKVALSILEAELHNPVDGARIQAVAALEEMGDQAKPLKNVLVAAKDDNSEYVKRIAERILARWKD